MRKKIDNKHTEALQTLKSGKKSLKWYSPKQYPFHVAGFYWFPEEKIYRRMPLKPEFPLPERVDFLANHTSGGQIRFRTDSTKIYIKVNLTEKPNQVDMAATGEGGFDCYIGATGPGQIYWSTTICKDENQTKDYEYLLFNVADFKMRDITLNFPLYQGVKKVLFGLDIKARLFSPRPFKSRKPVVVYGTSIVQGGGASRPGMSYTNILSRRLNREFINLGFAGNGRGEPEVAKTIAKIKNPALFILDYEWNCNDVEQYKKTLPEFIRILHEAHPDANILLISQCYMGMRKHYDKKWFKDHCIRKEFQKKLISDLRKKGARWIFFKDGDDFMKKDAHEYTVDGVHPTDLGFYNMTMSLLPIIKKLLV